MEKGVFLAVLGFGLAAGTVGVACGDDAGPVCGNGVVEAGEACDTGGLPGLCHRECGWARVSLDRPGTATRPSVAVTRGGCIVVGYESTPDGSLTSQAEAVVYDETGAAVWGPSGLSESEKPQGNVAVAGLGECGFVAVWDQGPEMDRDIYGRVFPTGTLGEAAVVVRLNEDSRGDRYEPAVAVVGGDVVVAAWTALYLDGDDASVAVRFLDAELAGQGPEFVANTYTQGPQERPAVAGCAEKVLVVWQSKCQEHG